MLSKTIKIQLAILTVVAVAGMAIMAFGYLHLPARLLGVGQYVVQVDLPATGNLYEGGNVTYRGTEVGRVRAVRLTETGVEAELSLDSDVPIPSDVDAQVHSQTAIGEMYVALLPRSAESPPLRDGDIIPRERASVPPDIGRLLDAANSGVQALPKDNLRTVVDETYAAVGGLGPEISRIVKGGTQLASDAQRNLDDLTALVDGAQPLLDTQTDTSDSVQAWASHLATVTGQLQAQNDAFVGVLENGAPAVGELQQLLDRVKPTLPIVLANLVSVGQVAVTYQNGIEQLLVLLPQGVAALQGSAIPDLNTAAKVKGLFLSFNLNLNVPPTCTTGFLPATQARSAIFEDAPDRPAGDLYCRTPQDSMWNVRGARNTPCVTRPGKRAPTVTMCESDEQYVPLNEGNIWKGDPNATLSGQGVPQLSPEIPPQPPPPPAAPAVAAASYDPATGTYLGPDGNVYTQADLAANAPQEKTWQEMLMPPPGK